MARRTLYGASRDERLAVRAHVMPKDARCVLEHENGSACYVYESAGKSYAIAFSGTAGRPLFHYSYRTEEARNLAIWNFRESVEQSLAHRSRKQTERAAASCTLKVGDIVNTSWGYDQTNVDFFIVTRVTEKMVWVRKIAQDYESTGYMSGRCWPAMPIQMVGEESKHVYRGDHFSIDGHGAHRTTGDRYSSSYA